MADPFNSFATNPATIPVYHRFDFYARVCTAVDKTYVPVFNFRQFVKDDLHCKNNVNEISCHGEIEVPTSTFIIIMLFQGNS